MNENNFTHIDIENLPTMVDVSDKNITTRVATAKGSIFVGNEIMKLLDKGEIATKKGPVFQTAIIGATMAVKKTHELIPFCHPLLIEGIKINIIPISKENRINVTATVTITGKTGVEMEALTGVSVALLTIYDMCKAINSEMILENIFLTDKTGGKKDYHRVSL